jgi:arginase
VSNSFVLTPYFLEARQPSIAALARPGWRINDGTRQIQGDRMGMMCELHRALAAEVQGIAARGDRPVSIAGDCCAAIPVLAGIERVGIQPLLVWLDAHGDFNTHQTTLSGFIGGMPLAMITGRGDQTLMEASGLVPLADERVLLADARDLDPPERSFLERSGVTYMSDLDLLVEIVAGRPIHVHLDLDIIDADQAPAMMYPVPGGPSVDTLCAAVTQLRTRARLISVSVTTWDVEKDTDGRTARACWQVLDALVEEL